MPLHLVNNNSNKSSPHRYKVFRTDKLGDTQVLALKALRKAVDAFDFWERPIVGREVNIMTDKESAVFLEKYMEAQGISTRVVMEDVEK